MLSALLTISFIFPLSFLAVMFSLGLRQALQLPPFITEVSLPPGRFTYKWASLESGQSFHIGENTLISINMVLIDEKVVTVLLYMLIDRA